MLALTMSARAMIRVMRARHASGSGVIDGRALGSSITMRSRGTAMAMASRVEAMGSRTRPSDPVRNARADAGIPPASGPGSTEGAEVASV